MTILYATWLTIVGLAFMLVGGLVLWAYGERRESQLAKLADFGIETEATRSFHQRESRWFFVYGSVISAFGVSLLLWAVTHMSQS